MSISASNRNNCHLLYLSHCLQVSLSAACFHWHTVLLAGSCEIFMSCMNVNDSCLQRHQVRLDMWLVAYYDTVVVNSVYEIISFRFYLVLKGYSSDYYVSVMGGRKGQDLSRGPDIFFFFYLVWLMPLTPGSYTSHNATFLVNIHIFRLHTPSL